MGEAGYRIRKSFSQRRESLINKEKKVADKIKLKLNDINPSQNEAHLSFRRGLNEYAVSMKRE